MKGVLLTVVANVLLRVLLREASRDPGVGVGYALNFCGSDVKQTRSPDETTGGAVSILFSVMMYRMFARVAGSWWSTSTL